MGRAGAVIERGLQLVLMFEYDDYVVSYHLKIKVDLICHLALHQISGCHILLLCIA